MRLFLKRRRLASWESMEALYLTHEAALTFYSHKQIKSSMVCSYCVLLHLVEVVDALIDSLSEDRELLWWLLLSAKLPPAANPFLILRMSPVASCVFIESAALCLSLYLP